MPALAHGSEKLVGVLERIIYFNDESHYCIGEFRDNQTAQTTIITGALPSVQCGETLELQGSWSQHPQHGPQFKITSFESKLPSTVHGIRMYLGSGLVPGVGKGYANKIVDYFKTDTLRIISEESARLKEVPGIGPQRAKSIKKAWDEQQALRDVFMFLKTYGISTGQCIRLVKRYGPMAIQILKNNPYTLAHDLDGIGFKTADKIALNLGLPNDGPARVDAGILFAMSELVGQGHTCTPKEVLLEKSLALLESDISRIEERIITLVKEKQLIELSESKHIQLPEFEIAERNISQSIARFLRAPSQLPPILIDKAIEWAQERAGFLFASEQQTAIQSAISSKISVITGGPGTGKTTILRALVDILKAKKARILLAAPTGRAAQRLNQATHSFAQTIHRLLKHDPVTKGFVHNERSPLNADFIIVDEASMIDTKLAKSFFSAIPSSAHIVLVGDINQLPSIGPGAILDNIINCSFIPTTSLNKIFRQKKCSNIITTAHAILEGHAGAPSVNNTLEDIESNPMDLQFIHAVEPEDCIAKVIQLYKDYLPKHFNLDPIMDIQVLVPLHKGSAGIHNFNIALQSSMNSSSEKNLAIDNTRFRVGDKVIQTRNNYDKGIFNGDLGKIISIQSESGTIAVDFEGQLIELERMEMTDLSLAYAISIHKSQGSEFPIVIIPLLKQHFIMLKRNLLYTGITRGRKKVFIVGDPIAYSIAVKNIESNTRQTALPEKLKQTLQT